MTKEELHEQIHWLIYQALEDKYAPLSLTHDVELASMGGVIELMIDSSEFHITIKNIK